MTEARAQRPKLKETYGELWDRYVSEAFPKLQEDFGRELTYPGEEWGSQESWKSIFEHLFTPSDVAHWKYAIEIGGGGGKYTERVLAANDEVKVWGFDVSRNFWTRPLSDLVGTLTLVACRCTKSTASGLMLF